MTDRRSAARHARRLVVITGASGSGKTTLAEAFSIRHPEVAEVLYFDQIGVPEPAEMAAKFGAPGTWQKAMTFQWMARIAAMSDRGRGILFEGQMRFALLHVAIQAAGLSDHRLILVDCDETTRIERLEINRRQPELANADMMNWARFLRDEAKLHGYEILDTSIQSIDHCVEEIRQRFG